MGTDASRNAYWSVLHFVDDGIGDGQVEFFSPERGPYSLRDIELRRGDVLHLVYVEDPDSDGLGARQEQTLGTAPDLADTDGDGQSDVDELLVTRTSPLIFDEPEVVLISPDARGGDFDLGDLEFVEAPAELEFWTLRDGSISRFINDGVLFSETFGPGEVASQDLLDVRYPGVRPGDVFQLQMGVQSPSVPGVATWALDFDNGSVDLGEPVYVSWSAPEPLPGGSGHGTFGFAEYVATEADAAGGSLRLIVTIDGSQTEIASVDDVGLIVVRADF